MCVHAHVCMYVRVNMYVCVSDTEKYNYFSIIPLMFKIMKLIC